MPAKNKLNGWFSQYKKTIITSIIGLVIAGAVPSTIYLHNAWGDDRYQKKKEVIEAYC